MDIILLSKFRGRPCRLHLGSPMQYVALLIFAGIVSAVLAITGYWVGSSQVASANIEVVRQEIKLQRQLIDQTRFDARADLDALAARLGEIQAQAMRLNALGQKLVTIAKLDKNEFNFQNSPGMGGPDELGIQEMDFSSEIDAVIAELEDREQQLNVLENILLSTKMQDEVFPAGRPIKRGWISSNYGTRTNPFSGKLQFHKGMDFAGKLGSDVLAVAGGVVTWSSDRYGYGNLVEINHGNGYITRYGHNRENLVAVGETVKRGQLISHMGSTGRSTGPHVHFEVLKNGRQINPLKFVQRR
ncbi:Peptidase, M23/M37 family [hydrothermal vent metagenome]|uniref:Peptidase, M23/M37 family n=1 Tax=hydrothermal vent metagenome TaxID=652676 RepID=A0A3B0WWE1_9ZZZZ